MDLPDLITSSSSEVARLIYKNSFQSKELFPFPWAMVMFVIKSIPERIFRRLQL